jgi:ABC-type antimicrobial peptide transport system permease subunit
MFKNYFITALRNLRHNKAFSAINILGLAIGISASLVIFLIVKYNFSFDKFEKGGDRIYRVVTNSSIAGNEYPNSGVCIPMGDAVQNEVTGLEVVAPFYMWDAAKVSFPDPSKDKPVVFKNQENIVFVNKNYFKLINYKWLAGSPQTSLSEPYQTVLTEECAKQYFPKLSTTDIIGKEIIFNDSVHTTITGIVKNPDQNTDFIFKTFISRATLEKTSLKPFDWDIWGSTNSASQLFIRLSPGTNPAKIKTQIAQINKKYNKPDPGDNSVTVHNLQPLNDVHFNSTYDNFGLQIAHKSTLYGLIAIAAFLLLLGCINFINLTTAQASQRAKEIGIRKTLGSSKKQLIFQFLSETFLLTIVATILSITITPLLLKAFSDFIPSGLQFNWKQPDVILFLSLVTVLVSLLSGFYPAIILSSYKPVAVLKNKINTNGSHTRNSVFRKTLTVSQFVIAQVFIIATIIVSKQINFSLNKDMGFKKDAIVYFTTNYYDTSKTNKKVLLEKLKAIPEIAAISLSNFPPSSNGGWSSTLKYKDGKKEIESDVQIKVGDTNYINLYKIKLLAGKNLPLSDTVHDLLINESYSKILGFKQPQEAIGKYIEWDNKQDVIKGVVADFNSGSLHEAIKPLVIASMTSNERTFNLALQPQNAEGTVWQTAIAKTEKAFKEVYPDDDFDNKFLDASIAKYYTAEQNISSLLKWATGLAIFISCLGLLGLVMYTTNQRTKEIGIRKVIGASVSQIILLLSKDFIRLVLIAFIIAVPVVYYAANKWLQNFAYRTNVNVWVFLIGGVIMLAMAMIVLLLKTYKAATANPVESLHTE